MNKYGVIRGFHAAVLIAGCLHFTVACTDDDQVDDPCTATPGTRNLALDGMAEQSSTWSADVEGSAAENAIDGNTSGEWTGGQGNTLSHTEFEDGAWWQVNLAQTSNVEGIVVWNRTTNHSQRMKDFAVVAYDQNGDEIERREFDMAPDPSTAITFDTPVKVKTVRVELLREDYLHLAEVQVCGTPE